MIDSLGGLLLPILRWLLDFTGNLGLAIILFTILTRILMLPLTIKQLTSQKKTMALQPQLRELQRKYGKDKEKLTQETMKLYSENGANPVSGCLPLLITLPILFGVWNAISQLVLDTTIDPGALQFLWIPNLAATNGDPFFILPVLSVVLQFIVQQMAMPRNPDPQQAQMNRIMMWMPLMFGWFAFSINAGAVLYMVAGSVIMMVQQFFTTGFGALPKYLPFLPERAGFLSPPPVGPDELIIDGADETSQPTKRDFWTVLDKLSQPLPTDTATASGAVPPLMKPPTAMQHRPSKAQRRRNLPPGTTTGDTTNADA